MIFFCLRLSKRRPRGQLSSSLDFETGKAGGQAQSSNWLGKNKTSGLGVSLPSSVHRLPETPALGLWVGRAVLTLNSRLPFLQGISTTRREVGCQSLSHPQLSANHKSSASLQLVTGQDPGQTLPPSKSDSPPPHWRQPSLWGWRWEEGAQGEGQVS